MELKGIVHPNMTFLWSYTHPQVVLHGYEFLLSIEDKRKYFEECWLPNSSGKKFIQVWKNLRLNKWWQKFIFLQAIIILFKLMLTFLWYCSITCGDPFTNMQVWICFALDLWINNTKTGCEQGAKNKRTSMKNHKAYINTKIHKEDKHCCLFTQD